MQHKVKKEPTPNNQALTSAVMHNVAPGKKKSPPPTTQRSHSLLHTMWHQAKWKKIILALQIMEGQGNG
jgi:hypothetical protein